MNETRHAVQDLGAVMRRMKEEAFAADPGLGRALEKARTADPDIGWLDVAAQREARAERQAADHGRVDDDKGDIDSAA